MAIYNMKHIPFLLAAMTMLWCSSCDQAHPDVENVIIKGSDTEVNLALALAEHYMEKDEDISIAVTGGGSGAGIAALINGKTGLANSSRPMRAEEIRLANARNVRPMASVFAMDGLAIIVHPELPVSALTVQQVGAIYRGEIENWREVGGPDIPISLYGRQSNSGTFVYFRDSVLRGEYARNLKQMNGTAQMVEGMKTDRAGIAYVGVGYVVQKDGQAMPGIKILPVSAGEGLPAVAPTDLANIIDGSYPIVRPLFQYTNGRPNGKLRDFMLFCLSEVGQQIVTESGYYPVSKRYQAQNEQVLNFSYADATSY